MGERIRQTLAILTSLLFLGLFPATAAQGARLTLSVLAGLAIGLLLLIIIILIIALAMRKHQRKEDELFYSTVIKQSWEAASKQEEAKETRAQTAPAKKGKEPKKEQGLLDEPGWEEIEAPKQPMTTRTAWLIALLVITTILFLAGLVSSIILFSTIKKNLGILSLTILTELLLASITVLIAVIVAKQRKAAKEKEQLPGAKLKELEIEPIEPLQEKEERYGKKRKSQAKGFFKEFKEEHPETSDHIDYTYTDQQAGQTIKKKKEYISDYARKPVKNGKAAKVILIIFLALILLAIVGGAAWYLLTVPRLNTENTVLEIDTTQFSMTGDAIVIPQTDSVTLPATIRNPGEEELTIDLDFGLDWFSPTKNQLTLQGGQTSFIDIVVTPENVEPGLYRLQANVNQGEETFSQEVLVEIVSDNKVEGRGILPSLTGAFRSTKVLILSAVLGFLVLLSIIILIWWSVYNKRQKKQSYLPSDEAEEARQQPVKYDKNKKKEEQGQKYITNKRRQPDYTEQVVLTKEFPWEKKGKRTWWKVLLFCIACLIVLGAIGLGGYYLVTNFANAPDASQDGQVLNRAEPASLTDSQAPVKIPLGKTIVPLKITNVNDTVTYNIRLKDTVDWITPQETRVEIPPKQQRTINLLVEPTKDVADGIYRVNIDIGVSEGQGFNAGLLLEVDKYTFADTIIDLLLYIIAGLVVLGIVIAIHYSATRKPLRESPSSARIGMHSEKERPVDTKKALRKTKLRLR
ncbi:hypothetical protein HYS47_01465 [Candidatus Woesearchaeota archaeon]|nr:hypothetical protein [Candidatus Woesearchaeota archaeon]